MPAKTTAPAAKKTAAAPAAKPAAPVSINFGALTVTDVAPDEVRHTRGSNVDNTPVKGWLADSKAHNTAKSVPLPNKAQADAFVVLLRSAAARLKIGVKILVTTQDGQPVTDKTDSNAPRVVKFLGKDKRAYKAADKNSESAS